VSKRGKRSRDASRRRGAAGPRRGEAAATSRAAAPRGKAALGLGPAEGVLFGPHAWIAFVVFLVALWVAFYHSVFFGGMTLESPDALAPAGFGVVGKEALQNGVYPLWNPYVFCGMPSYASLAYNPYVYPVGLALRVLWPLMKLPMMWLLIYYIGGGLGLFMLLKKLSLPAAAAGFGAAAFTFMPNLVAVGSYGHGSQLMASMYIPFIFLMAHRLMDRGRPAYAAGLALLFGLQLLRGHVQISYYTAVMIGVVAVYWTVRFAPKRGLAGSARPLGLAVLAVVLALGLASVLYIPVHDYSDLSTRAVGEHGGMGVRSAGLWSFSPEEMTTFVLPGALGFGKETYWGSMPFTDYPNYMGILALALALYAVVKLRRDPTVCLLAILGGGALLMSFGRHLGPLYEMAYRWLPFFKKFRVPVMVVILLQFSVSCLAGYGMAEVIRRRPGRGRALLWGMAAVALIMLVFLAGGTGLRESYTGLIARARGDSYASMIGSRAFAALRLDVVIVGAVALCGMALIYGYGRRVVSLGVLAIGLICLLCLDLWRVDYKLMESTMKPRGKSTGALRDDPVGLFLQKDKGLFRVYPLGRLFSDNSLTAYKIESVGGYHAAKPKLWYEWANAHLDPDVWRTTGIGQIRAGRDQRLPAGAMLPGVRRMLGIKYVISEGELKGQGLRPVFREGGSAGGGRIVYEVDDWLPKAFCVPEVRSVSTGEDALRAILSPSFHPEDYAVVEGDVELLPAAAGSAYVSSYGLNELDVRVESEGPTFLVVGDLYMKGWRSYLDGREVPIYKTDFLIRGVAVPEGRHEVRMQYFDPGLALGLKLGVGSAIVIIGMLLPASVGAVRSLRRRRRAT
jgi:hypothetical protein